MMTSVILQSALLYTEPVIHTVPAVLYIVHLHGTVDIRYFRHTF